MSRFSRFEKVIMMMGLIIDIISVLQNFPLADIEIKPII